MRDSLGIVLDKDERLTLCREVVSNFRQTVALSEIITMCSKEKMPYKSNKVAINRYALLGFSSLADAELLHAITPSIQKQYMKALASLEVESDDTIYDVARDTRLKRQTTTTINNYIIRVMEQTLERMNALTPANLTYNVTDLRERAILYYASLSQSEKIRYVDAVMTKHGAYMTRFSPKEFSAKFG